ncbi:hypothetical protein IFM89_003965 [Coptis chinensis]|uniref:Uncharacterized protein n=1 Tax=Coptis chinensis TaxID=261450 RepID=A0A835H468_9MAGN|nr:hypothetical protein IFM89_003965 [Coptis chinensis]
MERARALHSQVKKHQAEDEGLRAEKRKDEDIISALRKERDDLLEEIDGLTTKLRDSDAKKIDLACNKILLEDEKVKIAATLQVAKKDAEEKIDHLSREMEKFLDQLEKAKIELSRMHLFLFIDEQF